MPASTKLTRVYAALLAGSGLFAMHNALAKTDPFADPYPHPHAVAHVVIQDSSSSARTEGLVIHNAANMLKFYGPKRVEIEVVAYGPGIDLLMKDNGHAGEIRKLTKQGVMFAACENTMHHMHITRSQLNPAAHPVPSGAVAIIKRQQAGWEYLRP